MSIEMALVFWLGRLVERNRWHERFRLAGGKLVMKEKEGS